MAGPWEQYQRAAPTGPWDEYAKPAAKPRPRDTSFARAVALGAVKPLDNLATAVSNIPVIGPALDTASEALGLPTARQSAAANQAARAANTRTGAQMLGNVIGTLPTAAIPGGAVVQGATGGALLSDAEDAGGVLTDAAFGAGGSALASGAIRAVRGAVAPRVSDYVQRLTNAGVELTPGQVLGGAARRLENVATSIPFVGDAIRGAQRRGLESFNRATVDRALAPIGQRVPASVREGSEAVRYAGDALSREYEDVLPALGGQIDSTFTTRINAIVQRANLPPEEARQFAEIIRREIGDLSQAQNAPFTGRMMNQVRDRLDKVGAALRASTQSPYARELGDAVGQVREQVLALARRQNPDAADRLRALDKGWAELIRVEKAATNATEGVFTPGQYSTAVRQADRSVRRRAVARGQALGQDFADAARATLPSTVPDSGTAGRLMTMALGGGAVAAPGVVVPAAAAGAGIMGAYTAPATRAFQAGMTRQVGPAGNFVGRLLDAGRVPISVSTPALLRRPEQ